VDEREMPGHVRAPIVAHEDRALLAEVVEEPEHVVAERENVVRLDLARHRAPAVPAHVGGDRAVARRRQHGQLVPPGIPELGEAVAEDHGAALALLGDMELDSVGWDAAVGHAVVGHTGGR
jgi:hypothetical protein